MSISLYMDVHVRLAVTVGLRRHGVDVLTAQEDGSAELDDEALLIRATGLRRILVSQDEDFLSVAAQFTGDQKEFYGIFYGHQLRVTTGQMIEDIHLMVQVMSVEEWWNRIEYL